ncbi:MAG: hypothetical protein HFJ25_05690 [Clostridia bacterium]|nr:hypothetical protein [Clostridia bacterium]
MKKMDWKDIAKRTGKTFVQAFIASFGIDRLTEITDLESAKAVLYPMLISCAAAGLSAVWNMATSYIIGKGEW